MNSYAVLKTIHIISSTVLFGTGLGIAYFKWSVDRTRDVVAIRVVSEKVVLADWMFTTPAIVMQLVSGVALAKTTGLPIAGSWIIYALALYLLAGACWIPVVGLQLKMRNIARISDQNNLSLPAEYWVLARRWFWLGVPAFVSLVVVFWIMVTKPT